MNRFLDDVRAHQAAAGTLGRATVVAFLATLAWSGAAAAQSLFKCVGPDGRVAFQQRPCDGAGSTVEVRPASGTALEVDRPRSSSTAASPAPAVSSAPTPEQDEARDAPLQPPKQAQGRLDGWPKEGNGLAKDMSPAAVVRQWGRPHQVDIIDAKAMFFDYCDYRLAFFWNGKLFSWIAPFPESRLGATLFSYGESWKSAPMKWGIDRERKGYSHTVSERGDVQTWQVGRWIVTDAQGNIVSWCDTPTQRSNMLPPTRRTMWE